MNRIKYTTVYVAQGELEANLVKSYLEANGVAPVIVGLESIAMSMGIGAGPLARAKINVPEAFEHLALQLINDMKNSKFDQMDEFSDEDFPAE
jgi:hypothetical protein